jgi:hypothetical protein
MKPRHAAALALVGWYLMTPPCRTVSLWHSGGAAGGSCHIESQAPLQQWTRVPDRQEFEYKTDCERAISNDCHQHTETDGKSYLEGDLCSSECIAADDLRLKSK